VREICGLDDCPRSDGFDRLNIDRATLLCDPQIVALLQIQPKLWTRFQGSRKTQCRIRRDRAFGSDDVADSIGRYSDRVRERVGTHAQWREVLFAKDLAGVDGAHAVFHWVSPVSGNRQSRRLRAR
jgi:hypothetical protein